MRNVQGGVEDAGVSFQVKPMGAGTPTFTPARVLLAERETKMNLLSPGGATSLFHADIETGKVVREFKLAKDGVEIPMRDIASDSRGAQVGHQG